MTTNAELLAQYRRVLPSFLSPYYAEPISIERGEGSWVWDVEGTKYLDFFGGVLTTMVGHNNPARHRSHPRAGGEDAAHLVAVPVAADARPGRTDRRAVGHPRRPGVLHDIGVRGERHGDPLGDELPQVEPGARDAQQLPRPFVHDPGDHLARIVVVDVALRAPGELRAGWLPTAFTVRHARRRGLHDGVRRRPRATPRHDLGGRRGMPDRRADPRGRRVHRATRRLLRIDEEGARQPRDPVHRRRGPDRLGSHRRTLLGLRGPRHRPRHVDLRQGRRQRDHPGRLRGTRRDHGHDRGPQLLDVRRQPAVGGRRLRNVELRPRQRSPGEREGDGPALPSRRCSRSSTTPRGSPSCAAAA